MNNFVRYLTPLEAKQIDESCLNGRRKPIEYYEALAKIDQICSVCEGEKVWRYADLGMCFSCTTGESDASDDYEITLDKS